MVINKINREVVSYWSRKAVGFELCNHVFRKVHLKTEYNLSLIEKVNHGVILRTR